MIENFFLRAALGLLLLLAPSAGANLLQMPTSGGGGSAWTLIAHNVTNGGNPGGTSAALNTTGATLLVMAISYYSQTGIAANGILTTISDSSSNTWVSAATTTNNSGSAGQTQLLYVVAPTTSASHTFTVTSLNCICVFEVQAWSGNTVSPFDQVNHAQDTTTGSTVQTGSITPTLSNELIISSGTAGGGCTTCTLAVNSGFTLGDNVAGGASNYGGAIAYLKQGAAAAVNPTWTTSSSATDHAAAIMSFKRLP